MENIGERLIWHYVPFTDIALPLGGINVLTVFNTLVVMLVLLTLMFLATRKLEKIPGRGQLMVEMFVGAFDKSGGVFARARDPWARTASTFRSSPSLFCFLLLSNFMGFLSGS